MKTDKKTILYKVFFTFLLAIIYLAFSSTNTFASSTWINKGNLNTQRYLHSATLLSDGKVIVIGGERNGLPVRQAEIFNPTTGSWANLNLPKLSRRHHVAELVKISSTTEDTSVLVAGGIAGTDITNTAELYNPVLNTWTFASSMSDSRWFHSSSILNNGKILITGGASTSGFIKEKHNSTEIYDPIANTWTFTAPLNIARAYHEQITFKDVQGNIKVMVIGGIDTNGNSEANALSSIEIYDISSNTWSFGPSMNYKRFDFSAITLPDGRILVVGGNINNDTTYEIYNPINNSWNVFSATKAFKYGGAMALVGNGINSKVLTSGGNTPDFGAQLFDPLTNIWSVTESMNNPRSRFTLTTLKDGSVLAAAGASENSIINTSEIYKLEEVPTPTPTQVPTPTPTPQVLGDSSTGPKPFMDLPWAYGNENFMQQVFDPVSWFDHEYPLQNIGCCVQKVRSYSGKEIIAPYRSHAGYDYASKNKVEHLTPVLAAASGSASFTPESQTGGLGNTIKINHGNGYQTWYGHLDLQGINKTTRDVQKGEQIGLTGYSGNIYPNNKYGSHIHFAVFKDENGNKNFADDYPYGLVDPLGWEGDYVDPWTEYESGGRRGAASYNLFLARSKPVQKSITSAGSTVEMGKVQINVPAGASPVFFTLSSKYGSFESDGNNRESIVPSIFLTAFDNLNNKITQFFQQIKISYNYSEANLQNIKEDTIKLHHYNEETKVWEPLPTTLDKPNKTAVAYTSHFSHFALMGEVKDETAPTTDTVLQGTKEFHNWYRSSVEVGLNTADNEGGVGIESTLYTTNGIDWFDYIDPVVVNDEGKYTITYQSRDKAYNLEDQKSITFIIDKTKPVTTATLSGTQGNNSWYVSDVLVALAAEDKNEVAKIEYSQDGGETYFVYANPFTISDEGSTTLFYRSTDVAGNVEDVKQVAVKVDKTPPSTLLYSTGLKGSNNWYRSNVEVAFNVNDVLSGFQKTYYSLNGRTYIEYTGPMLFSEEDETKIVFYSVDQAGNTEEQKEFTIRIDKTAPEARFSYDITQFAMQISGKDRSETAIVTTDSTLSRYPKYLITDKAGNSIRINTSEILAGKQVTQTIQSLQYNEEPIIELDTNRFFTVAITNRNNSVKQLSQHFSIKGEEKVFSLYSSRTESTTISIKNDLSYESSTKPGIILLMLETNNGQLDYSY